MKSSLSLLSLSAATAATIDIAWQDGFSDPTARAATAAAGDVVKFTWGGSHNVYSMADQTAFSACNFVSSGDNLGSTSPVSWTVPADAADGAVYYFGCEVSSHCNMGQKLALTVATAAVDLPSVSLTTGNTCPGTQISISSWEHCRASLAALSPVVSGDSFNDVEDDADWPQGCYYCDGVSGCTDGVWFNAHSVGSSNDDAQIVCADPGFFADLSSTLLFVGDSDIDYWSDSVTAFPPLLTPTPSDTFNVGYGGYTCADVLTEADDFIAKFTPKNVVLVCGENDLPSASAAKTFARYQNVVNKYLASGARVVSISTKPEPGTTELHDKYEQLDALIKEWATGLDEFTFIDSYNGFKDAGNAATLYDDDDLHLSESGYAMWQTWTAQALLGDMECEVWRSGECVQGGSTVAPTAAPTENPTEAETINGGDGAACTKKVARLSAAVVLVLALFIK